jgi:hypothetical protein
MYPRCAGLDVHKETVVACVRIVAGGEVSRSVRTFATTTVCTENLIRIDCGAESPKRQRR